MIAACSGVSPISTVDFLLARAGTDVVLRNPIALLSSIFLMMFPTSASVTVDALDAADMVRSPCVC